MCSSNRLWLAKQSETRAARTGHSQAQEIHLLERTWDGYWKQGFREQTWREGYGWEDSQPEAGACMPTHNPGYRQDRAGAHYRSPLLTHMQAGVACPQRPHLSMCSQRARLNEAEERQAPGLAHTGRWGWIWPSPQGLSNLGSWAEIWAQRR